MSYYSLEDLEVYQLAENFWRRDLVHCRKVGLFCKGYGWQTNSSGG